MKYFKKLKGEKCYLSPINANDVEQYTEWLNDLEISGNLSMANLNISLNTEKEALEKLIKGHNYAIIDQKKDELLGNCSLASINYRNGTAELGIFIGDKNYRNKGYGTEAINLLLSYAFNHLNLKNIILRVLSSNKGAINCYKKCGFKMIGKRRKAITQNMKEYDIIYMDILVEDFTYFK